MQPILLYESEFRTAWRAQICGPACVDGESPAMNIRSKLSLSFLATVVTLSVALSAIIARDTVSLAKESIAYDAALQAKMIDRVFETFIDKVKADVEYLAKNYRYQQIPVELSKYMDSTPRLADSQAVGGFEAELENYYAMYATKRDYLTNIYLATIDGGFVNLINNVLSDYDPRKRSWYVSAVSNPFEIIVTAPYIGMTKVNMISVATTVTRTDGTLIGVQSVDVTLGWLTSMIDAGTIWDSGYLMLVAGDGTIMADPRNRDNIFKNIAELSGPPYEGLANALLRQNIETVDDSTYELIFYPSKISDWQVIAVIDRAVLVEMEKNIVISIWSVTGPLALVFIVLGVYLAGRITRPIDHVSESLRHMVEGDVDFDNALDVTSNDEIGKLAMRFNAFLRSAKKKQSALVHSQKLESIGRLAAGMAQEIDRPAQSIGDNTRFLEKAFRNLNSLITRLVELAANAKDSDLLESIREAMREADVEKLHVEIPRAIERSLQGVRQVSEIVGAMGEFSQPSQEMTQMDLNSAIRNTIMVGGNAWRNVATVTMDLDPDLPPLTCLPGAINEVILSIIVNAAQAIGDVVGDAPQEKGSISVSTRMLDGWVEIRIKDNGPGMPEDVRTRVFDPFFTTKKVGTGTGQGLSVAYAVIVEKHAGTINVDSKPGQGACFTIRLPMHEWSSTGTSAVA